MTPSNYHEGPATRTNLRLDAQAILACAYHWLQKIHGNYDECGTNTLPGGHATFVAEDLVGLLNDDKQAGCYVEDIGSTESFGTGIVLGIAIAAAVVTDPFGDPTRALKAALKDAHAAIASERKSANGHYCRGEGCEVCKLRSPSNRVRLVS